jgi:hypothetical protein
MMQKAVMSLALAMNYERLLNSILGYSQLLQKQEQLSEQGKMALG